MQLEVLSATSRAAARAKDHRCYDVFLRAH